MSEPSVRLEGVTKRFGDFVAVRELDLEIAEGEFFTLLGPCGCGKTTTLRMIAGFEEPTERPGPDRRRRRRRRCPPHKRPTNTVFQSYALFPHLSVGDNVAFGLERKKVAQGRDRAPRRRGARARRARRRRPTAARTSSRAAAAARRARARAGQPAQGPAARRAARRARPEAAQGPAGRAQADPARGRDHVRLRHPRPGGGADDVRPDRGHEPRPRSSRSARARGGLRAPDDHLRRRLHRRLEPDAGRRHVGRERRPRHGAPRQPASRSKRRVDGLARGRALPRGRPPREAADRSRRARPARRTAGPGVEGVVESSVFLGTSTQIVVRLAGDVPMTVLVPNADEAERQRLPGGGARCGLSWAPEHMHWCASPPTGRNLADGRRRRWLTGAGANRRLGLQGSHCDGRCALAARAAAIVGGGNEADVQSPRAARSRASS